MRNTSPVLLRVSDLHTTFSTREGTVAAVNGVDLTVHRGEFVGIVGESGCGKSATARSILRLLPPNARVERGTVEYDGRDLSTLSSRQMRDVRGRHIGFVAQNPFGALNPILPIWKQFRNVFRYNGGASDRASVMSAAQSMLDAVGIVEPERVLRGYAHELSGGMAQRVVISMSMVVGPEMILADEPTTALDVTVQKQILDLIRGLATSKGTAVLLVTHDLGVVGTYCDRVAVMYGGRVIEEGPVDRVFGSPEHPYTASLLASVPQADAGPAARRLAARAAEESARPVTLVLGSQTPPEPPPPPAPTSSSPVLEVEGIRKTFVLPSGRRVEAVRGVSFSVEPGRTLALIGESGSGKSTVGRCVLGLLPVDGGRIEVAGRAIVGLGRDELRTLSSTISVVLQEPYESLNPRMRIEELIGEPLLIHRRDLSRAERARMVRKIMDEVGLPARLAQRWPRELSGGQQQRVGIARALIIQPRVVVLDEPTSSLDLSVQAQILVLLSELQREHGLSYLYISHDIGTVSYMADRIAVMRSGAVVEEGDTLSVLRTPQDPYTRLLLDSVLQVPGAHERALEAGQHLPERAER